MLPDIPEEARISSSNLKALLPNNILETLLRI
jgi:hypothetical protein